MITMLLLTGLGFLIYKYGRFNYSDMESITFGTTAKLKWHQVKTIYNSNPRRWRFEKIVEQGYSTIETSYKALLFNAGDAWEKEWIGEGYHHADKIVRIQLSFIDYIKFLVTKKFKPANTKGIEMILKATQADIDALAKIANIQIKEANDEMQEIKERIQKGVTLEL